MSRYARRVDGNQRSIVGGLRRLESAGVSVSVTSRLGEGFPDIVVGYQGVNYIVEIKDPAQRESDRKLTASEQSWHDSWTGQVAVCETLEEILELIGFSLG